MNPKAKGTAVDVRNHAPNCHTLHRNISHTHAQMGILEKFEKTKVLSACLFLQKFSVTRANK